MANEYLQRTPTSTGNRRVFTWSGWVKRNVISSTNALFSQGVDDDNSTQFRFDSGNTFRYEHADASAPTDALVSSNVFRDVSNWCHFVVSVDTTQEVESNRIQIYFNGDRQTNLGTANYPTINFDTDINTLTAFKLGALASSGNYHKGELADVFFIDGQALTPDVFGFYKEGKGYISAGSTQATDFRPGQWVPKTPRVIKAEIERNGGFGVNGFYLPMNDSSNFGADFHCEPNSIITLKGEDLPQPRNGAPTTTDAYVSQLRTDPYAANLVLALPFVSGGLGTDGTSSGINTGFGDYSHIIRNSGVAKTVGLGGTVSIATVGVGTSASLYYGSSALFDGGNSSGISVAGISQFTGDFTIEMWMYPRTTASSLGGNLFGDYGTGQTSTGMQLLYYNSSLIFYANNGYVIPGSSAGVGTPQVNQWNHVALSRKATNLSLYLNGVAVGINTNSTATYGAANSLKYIGVDYPGSGEPFNGHIQDVRVYNGVAKYKGGFDVPKPYTPVGIATWRAVPDCTANNFATWNPLAKYSTESSLGLSNGNLTATADASVNKMGTATVGVTTGKWYYEFSSTSANSYFEIGIGTYAGSAASTNGLNYKCYSGNIEIENVSQTNVSSLGANEVLGIALNATDGLTTFYKDGVQIANVSFTSPSGLYIPQLQSANGATHVGSANFGQNPTFSGQLTAGTYTDGNGKGLFKYQPPSGFLALCEDNLPTPAISNPGEYFKTVLYTGDSASGRSITGIGFTPDLVWIKSRTNTGRNQWNDSVRGATFRLRSDVTNAEDNTDGVISFNSDGFSLGNDSGYNLSGQNYAAWCWRAGAGTTSTNTDGSIQSVVSVNQDAGFSIVSYTGNGVDGATIGHGLGKSPALIIAKGRDNAVNWPVYHKSTTASNFLYLNSTSAALASSAMWNSNPTSSAFYVGNQSQNNTNGIKYIAYCWAEIEGFSKFGSYVGNGSADGPFVYCGFKPAWVLIKKTDSSASWVLEDSARNSTNPAFSLLQPNTSSIEDNGSAALTSIDFLSNGFKIRGNWADDNASGSNYIFAAFAESPINYSNAK